MNDEFSTLNELLVKNFKDILRIEERVLNKREETKGLSMNEIHTLEIIGIDSEQIMSNIAKKLRVTPGTLSISISRLFKKGYIEKIKHDKDGRAIIIMLTDKGKEVYRIHEEFHKEMIDTVIKDLDMKEFKAVIEFLNRINSFFGEKYKLN